MLYFAPCDESPEIHLNLSDANIHVDGETTIPDNVQSAWKILASHPFSVPITDVVVAAMDAIIDSDVCISPVLLQSPVKPLHRAIAEYFVTTSEFAGTLFEELDAKKAFDFIDRVKPQQKQAYRGTVMRLLAPFAVSAIGPTAVHAVPAAFIHAIVDYYRSGDGSRWNEDILRSDVAKQCARAIVLGLGKVYDDPTLSAKSVVGPKTGRGSRSWIRMAGSTEPLSKELVIRKNEFSETSRMNPNQAKQSVMDIEQWLSSDYPGQTLSEIFQSKDRSKTFSDFIGMRAGKTNKTAVAQVSFAKRLLDAMAEQIEEEIDDETVRIYPLITDKELARLKNATPAAQKHRPTSSRSRPLPEKLFSIATAILDEGEDGPLGKSGYFHVKKQIRGKVRSIYCPVIPTLLRCAFDIPLRMVQWRRLDSGEGDMSRYDAASDSWAPNPSPLARYWAQELGVPPDKVASQGYAHRFDATDPVITGFWVNTNKTGEPYALPWQHREVHLRLAKLRDWQEKLNPVTVPTNPKDYIDGNDTPKITLKELPKIFPLFRLLLKGGVSTTGRIPTTSEMDHAWQFFMHEVEKRWNLENQDEPISIVSFQKTTGQAQRSIYNMHGLRVRGLTNLYRTGVPLHLLSKMVAGHATLTMTLYYLEFLPSNINDLLSKAALEASALAQRDLINSLKIFNVEQARLRTVSLEPAAIEQAIASPSKLEYCNVDIGVCPFDCTRCSDGGPVTRKQRLKNGIVRDKYGAVESRNCVVCRHFITGPEWIVPLQLYGSKLCEKRRYLAEKILLVNKQVEGLRAQFEEKSISRELYRQSYDALQSEIIPVQDEIVHLEQAIFNTEVLLKASVQLMEADPNGNGGNYVAASRESVVEYVETTQFDHSLMLTSASRIHPILGEERVEAYRNRHLDRIAFNSGMVPATLAINLTPEQCRKSLDLQARFLMEKTSANERSKLVDGEATLETLGYREEITSLVSEALGQPMSIHTLPKVQAIAGDVA